MTDHLAEILFHFFFFAGGYCEQLWHGQGCPLFNVVHPAFPLPTTASPTLQGALNDGFGEAVLACDVPQPCKFSFLDSGQKRFLWTHKEVALAPHLVFGLVLHVGDTVNFPHALGFKTLDHIFCQSQQAGSMFNNHIGGWC